MKSELKIRLDRIVNDLAKTDGIDGSLIVDGNGEVLSHHLLHDVDIELFGPMANVITGSSKRLTTFSNQGEIERILVESKKGKALFLHLGNVHFIVLMKDKANVGMIMISSKRASEEIIDLTKDLTPIQLEEQITGEEVVDEVKTAGIEEKVTEKVEEKPVEITEEKPVEITEEKPVEEEKETVKVEDKPVKDLKPPVEEIAEPAKASEISASSQTETKITSTQTQPEVTESEKSVVEEIKIKEPVIESTEPSTEISETVKTEAESIESEVISTEETMGEIPDSSDVAVEKEEEKPGAIPVIRPPITFPKLKKITEIPKDQSERVDLLFKVYESIFLAMSIGAGKIMGVAPARGLTRKFLPVEDCKTLLDGVDVKNNSAIDFTKIKENADKIPLENREKIFKESFGKIITIITENYGKVMGYAAFRAMIRPEFKIINESYGHLLDELGVKEQLHPELRDFFN